MVLGWISAVKQIIDSGGNISLEDAHTITCPVLLMLGRDDAFNPEYLGRKLVERIPNGRLVMVDGGHPVHREHPEVFREALWQHLQAADAL
jgi:pimeloyl-ACP methyl ester carboxylesterase